MQQLCDYKVRFKGQKRHIIALLDAIAQGVNTRNGDSWQYKAILCGLGGSSHYGLVNNFDMLSDSEITCFISGVAFIQEESQVSKQHDFFRTLFGLVPELEGRAEVEYGGSSGIEKLFSPCDSHDVQISHHEYGGKPWFEAMPDSFKYQDVKLHGLDSTECSERLEFINFGEILEKKKVLVREDEWRVGLFTAKGQVGYLPHDVSSVVMDVMELEFGTFAAMITVSSVTPVSKRRKGSKYGLLEVNITFSKPVRDLAKCEKSCVFDSNHILLKNYIDNLPNIEDVVPEGLAFTEEQEEEPEFTFSVTMRNAETGETVDLNEMTEKEEESKTQVDGVSQDGKVQVYGMPQDGKRVEIFDNLSIRLPYGAAYSRPEDGGCNILMLSPIPPNYHAGSFKVSEDAPKAWSISFGSGLINVDCKDTPKTKAMEAFQEIVKKTADSIAGKNNKDTSLEELSHSSTTESDGEYTYTHTMNLAMGKGDTSEMIVENNIVICRATMNIQIGMAGSISYNWVLVGTLDYPNATIYRGQLYVDGDVDRVFSKKIVPILKTIESVGSTPKTPEEMAKIAKIRQEDEKRWQKQEEECKHKEKCEREAKAKMQQENQMQEQKEEQAEKEHVEKEKEQLKKKRNAINVKLQTANEEKEQQAAEIAEIDRQIAEARTALKFTPFWKGARKQEINVQITDLNAKKSYLEIGLQKIYANINSLRGQISVIDSKLSLILTTQEIEHASLVPFMRGGASEETRAKANAIASVLTSIPMTSAEINVALNTEYTALQVMNAVKFIKGVYSTKVLRTNVNYRGVMEEKEYTAYFIQ